MKKPNRALDTAPTQPLDASDAANESAAPQLLERLVRKAEEAGASDIHLQMLQTGANVSFRLDGVMVPVESFPAGLAERVFGRIKFLARLKTYQDSLPQDGRIDKAELNAEADIRVATYPTTTGEKVVLRLFHQTSVKPLRELGFSPEVQSELHCFLRQASGMLLLTGPSGSGKTTTIYASLGELVELGGRHIITAEDPAEQLIAGVMQTEVNEARGLDFARAARHLLRQDPQVLVIGEIRDEETANVAVRAALTGHLVISTLHAGSCHGVLERLLVLCPDRSAIAASLGLVLNQRLVRRSCAACNARGCPSCLNTGYRGRVPMVEWLRLDDAARNAILTGQLRGICAQPSLFEAGALLARTGAVSQSELNRVLGLPTAQSAS